MKKLIITAALVNAFVFLLIAKVSANPVENITNWISNEKAKTIAFQKKSWAKSKEQWTDLISKFGLKGKEDGSQN